MAAFAGRSHLIARAAAVALALTAIGAAETAHAQGLFNLLRGMFGGRPPVQRVEPPMLLDGFPQDGIQQGPAENGGPYVAYCVRLCDGRYFPLPRRAGEPSMSPDKVCSAMCPAAKTKIFSGTNISHAVASDGKNYTGIANAFLYREKLVNDCSCTEGTTTGVASMNAKNDPTLRRGDIVVTGEGPMVYTGNGRLPHAASDFKPAEDYKGLPKRIRQQLSEMRVGEEIEMVSVGTAQIPPVAPPPAVPEIIRPNPVGPHASLSYAPAKISFVGEAFSAFRR